MHRRIVLLLSLAMFWSGFSVAHSQLIVNGTTLFDSSGAPTGNTAHAVEGGDVSVSNAFPVSITVRVYNERNELIAEAGILAGNRYHGPHGLSAGTYGFTISSPQPIGAEGGAWLQISATIAAPFSPSALRPDTALPRALAATRSTALA